MQEKELSEAVVSISSSKALALRGSQGQGLGTQRDEGPYPPAPQGHPCHSEPTKWSSRNIFLN